MDNETNTDNIVKPTQGPLEQSKTHQLVKGLIIGFIVFSVILISVIYISTANISMPASEKQQMTQKTEPANAVPDEAVVSLQTQGTGTDISDIEKDLNATDLSSLDDIDSI